MSDKNSEGLIRVPEIVEMIVGTLSQLLPALLTGVLIFLLFWIVAITVRALLRRIACHRDAEKQNILRLI